MPGSRGVEGLRRAVLPDEQGGVLVFNHGSGLGVVEPDGRDPHVVLLLPGDGVLAGIVTIKF